MSTDNIRRREVTATGLRTVLREAGPQNSSEAVVFCHGNPGPSDEWVELMARVAGFTRAVAWDAPGFGQAEKPADFSHTVDAHAAFIGAVLDKLGIDRAHLVLHDFGVWGLHWAADHPQRFASAVLINTGVLFGYRWHWMARAWQMPLLGELAMALASPAAARRLVRWSNPRLSPEAVDRIARSATAPRTKLAILRLYRSSRGRALDSRLAALSARLRLLDRPVLVVWGEDDPLVPVRYAKTNLRTFPAAEVTVVEGSSHWPFLDSPEVVGDRVAAFLGQAVGR